MKVPTLISRLTTNGFTVTLDGDEHVSACPCCQYWLTPMPHPAPPLDVDGDAPEAGLFRFKVNPRSEAGHATSWCQNGCSRQRIYALLGSVYYLQNAQPCTETPWCYDKNKTQLTFKQQTEMDKFFDQL